MEKAYSLAYREIIKSINNNSQCLDCGANAGNTFYKLKELSGLDKGLYNGIEWDESLVFEAKRKNLSVIQGDLNKQIPFPDDHFGCVFALSLLEHLINPCSYLKECHRVLKNNGTIVILTPNISTFFTAVLILLGKMPSSGPHPDSDLLNKTEEIIKVSQQDIQPDTESDTPVHRHIIVFSYRVLIKYLKMIGFKDIKGYGFGYYPFPKFIQPLFEKIDPYHCHQMVIIAKK